MNLYLSTFYFLDTRLRCAVYLTTNAMSPAQATQAKPTNNKHQSTAMQNKLTKRHNALLQSREENTLCSASINTNCLSTRHSQGRKDRQQLGKTSVHAATTTAAAAAAATTTTTTTTAAAAARDRLNRRTQSNLRKKSMHASKAPINKTTNH